MLGNGGSSSFAFITGQFSKAALGAANGDATAMANLRGAASDNLAAAKDNASTLEQYNAARAEVLAATDKSIFAAESKIDYQQAVIDAAKASQETARLVADMKEELAQITTQIALTANEQLRLWRRVDGDGFANPLRVTVTA